MPFLAATDDAAFSQLDTLLRVNTLSYMTLTAATFPLLEESHGRIAVVSSAAGNIGLPMVWLCEVELQN
jgi:short-subunit dehydrogenase